MSAAPEWLKAGARVYYRPSVGGQQFAAVCDEEPQALGLVPGSYVVRLRDVEAPYGVVHHGDSARTTVKAAEVSRLEPRGVLTAREVLQEVQGKGDDEDRAVVAALTPAAKETFARAGRVVPPHPPIVTLCGSTRFRKAFESATYRLTLEGWAVFSVGSYAREHGTEEARDALTDEQKHNLDSLHLRKIGMSARVHVLNPGGYIGESTAGEIACAFALGIPITFLDEDAGCRWLEEHSHRLGRAVAEHVEREARR